MSEEELDKYLKITETEVIFKKSFYEAVVMPSIYNANAVMQEYKQLKEQLKLSKQELKGFTNTIAECLGFDEPEHTIYDEIFDKINQLKIKLQQRDSVIKEAIEKCRYFRRVLLIPKTFDEIIDILNKYKKEESE